MTLSFTVNDRLIYCKSKMWQSFHKMSKIIDIVATQRYLNIM